MNDMWQTIVNALYANPRDVKTIPLNRSGKWFYAYSDGISVYITNSKSKKPSCSIKGERKLNSEEFEPMIDLYLRRNRGEQVSQEAIRTTVNQVYWYGILNEFSDRML